MSNASEVLQAIAGLLIGAFIFITFGAALANTTLEGSSFVNFQFWGVLYLLGAIVLGVAFVGGIIASVMSQL